MTIKKKIGRNIYPFTVEGKNLHDVVIEAQKLSFHDVLKCGNCDSDLLILGARVTKSDNYKYTYIKCLACGSELTFGKKKEDENVVFLRKVETEKGKVFDWRVFETENGKKPAISEDSDDDGIPF